MMSQRLTVGFTLLTLSVVAGCDTAPTEPRLGEGRPQFSEQAAEQQLPIAGEFRITRVGDRASDRITPGGIRYVRELETFFVSTGDVVGTGVLLQSYTRNLRNENGAAHGPFTFDAEWNGLSGVITGTYAVNIHLGFTRGTWVGQGSGELAGHKFRFDGGGPLGGPTVYTGYVVTPPS